jgi:hypothetical protein
VLSRDDSYAKNGILPAVDFSEVGTSGKHPSRTRQ